MSRPKNLDLSQLAKRIVSEAAGDESAPEKPKAKNETAARSGRLGGPIGGAKRSTNLSPEQRRAIAKKAAAARWKTD